MTLAALHGHAVLGLLLVVLVAALLGALVTWVVRALGVGSPVDVLAGVATFVVVLLVGL